MFLYLSFLYLPRFNHGLALYRIEWDIGKLRIIEDNMNLRGYIDQQSFVFKKRIKVIINIYFSMILNI
jgi:hypothetical protein